MIFRWRALPLLVAGLGMATAHAEGTDERRQALEARIAQLEAAEPGTGAAATPERLQINGFLSAGFGWADTEDGQSYEGGLNDRVSHTRDSVVGLQFDGRINDRTRAVLQLVGRGGTDFDASVEWAYVSWQLTDADELRIGRQRDRLYLLSEYLEVGYTYPWARPPAEIYRPDHPSAFDGVTWRHELTAGQWQHDLSLSWGTPQTPDKNETPIESEGNIALGIASEYGDWRLGAEYTTGRITISNPVFDAFSTLSLMEPIDKDRAHYYTVGAQYDDGKRVLLAEATQVEVDGTLPDSRSAYVTVGHRFGKWLPHVTWASTSMTDGGADANAMLPLLCPAADPDPNTSLCLAIVPNTLSAPPPTTFGIPFPVDTLPRMFDVEQDSVTVGVRYDFLSNAALKVDWTRVLDTHGTLGLFSPDDGNIFTTPIPEDETDVLRVVIDIVF